MRLEKTSEIFESSLWLDTTTSPATTKCHVQSFLNRWSRHSDSITSLGSQSKVKPPLLKKFLLTSKQFWQTKGAEPVASQTLGAWPFHLAPTYVAAPTGPSAAAAEALTQWSLTEADPHRPRTQNFTHPPAEPGERRRPLHTAGSCYRAALARSPERPWLPPAPFLPAAAALPPPPPPPETAEAAALTAAEARTQPAPRLRGQAWGRQRR